MNEQLTAELCRKWHRGVLILRHLTRDRALLWCSVCETFR